MKNYPEFSKEVLNYINSFVMEEVSKYGTYFPELVSYNLRPTDTPDTVSPEHVFHYIPIPRITLELVHMEAPDLQEKADEIRSVMNKEMMTSFFNDRIGYLLAQHLVEPILKTKVAA